MKKQFIVNTPFGIGVATSEEDLKDMLSFVEGIAGEGAERSEAQQEEACDCENCQHNAQASEEKLTLFSLFLSSVDELATLAFIEKDLTSDMNATFLALGEGHPQVIHFEKMLDLLKERIAEVSSEDAVPDAQLSEEQLLERLSEDIAQVNKVDSLEVLHRFREFMTAVLESDNPNKKREAELLIGKIDERITELAGESDAVKPGYSAPMEGAKKQTPFTPGNPSEQLSSWISSGSASPEIQASLEKEHSLLPHDEDSLPTPGDIDEMTNKVENKTTWGKRNPDLLDLDYVSTTVDIGADMLASIDLGYTTTKEEMTRLISRSTDILDEYLKSEVEKMNAPEAPVEDSPDEEPLPTLEEIKAMTDYDKLDKLQIELQAEQWRLSDKKQAIINEIHSEMKHVEELHAAASERKGGILNNKADIARADIAESLKVLQEAITRGGQHLLIHEDIHEAMEILQERYRK